MNAPEGPSPDMREAGISFPEIHLAAGDTEALVSPTRGGIISGFKVGGYEIFYLDRSTFNNPDKNVRGGSPELFPQAGPGIKANGIDQPNHGVARTKKWREGKRVTTQDADAITMHLDSDEETMAQYPYDFSLAREVKISRGGILVDTVTITNNDDKPMPTAEGRHPYLLCPDIEKAGIRSNISGFDSAEAAELEEYDVPFQNPGNVRIYIPGDSTMPPREITIDSDPEIFQNFYLWMLKGKPFLAAEPWTRQDKALIDPTTQTLWTPPKTEEEYADTAPNQPLWVPPHASVVLPITISAKILDNE